MSFISKHVAQLRQKHQKQQRSIIYIMACAPVLMWALAMYTFLHDPVKALMYNLEAVDAKVVQGITTTDQQPLELVYFKDEAWHTAVVPVEQVYRNSSDPNATIDEDYQPGKYVTLAVNDAGDIVIFSFTKISYKLLLVLFFFTLWMGFVTFVWTMFIFGITKVQGLMLAGMDQYVKRNKI